MALKGFFESKIICWHAVLRHLLFQFRAETVFVPDSSISDIDKLLIIYVFDLTILITFA